MSAHDIRTLVLALFAMAFALVGLITLIAFGDHDVRRLAAMAALLGCVSQFAAQGSSPTAQRVSVTAAYTGFGVVLIALLGF